MKVAVDLRVHEHVPEHGSISLQELASAVGADESLLSMHMYQLKKIIADFTLSERIMRLLTNKHIFSEPESGYYAHTAMSWMICDADMYHLLSHR